MDKRTNLRIYGKLALIAGCFLVMIPMLWCLICSQGNQPIAQNMASHSVMDRFDGYLDNVLEDARTGALSVPKRFWIKEGDPIPKRDDSRYGTAESAAELSWLLEEAAPLLDGQETLFTVDTPIREGTVINYYYDESILAITWQQIIDRIIYTIAEVKICDPSQFRRYLVDDVWGSHRLMTTTALSKQAGAVIAGSGDHFRARKEGIVVYDREVKRFAGEYCIDNCFVDTNGDLILTPRGTFFKVEEVTSFIEEHDIRFGFAFGPILVKDGKKANPAIYTLGEVLDTYPRAALCQKDKLHYLIVTVNGKGSDRNYPTIDMLATEIEKFNVQQAYSLDGGQTGAIAMQDKLMNPNEYKTGQRAIGDMFFFHTAVPNKE